MQKEDVVKKLKEIGVIEKRKVILRSGKKSNFYCDIKKSYGYPDIIDSLSEKIASIIKGKTNATSIAASGMGGIPLATLVSKKINLPLILVRDFEKDHGKKEIICGYTPTESDRVVIIDDVFTTGSSISNTISALRENTKASIDSAVVAVKRGENKTKIPLHYIFNIDELL